MSRQATLPASRIQLLRRSIVALAVLALATAASAQTISTQAISEPAPVGFVYRFFSPDGQWVCFAVGSLRCAPSNASTLASLHNPPQQTGSLVRRPRFIPGTNRILYTWEDSGDNIRLWTVVAGQPQSAADVTPQWPAADIEGWVVSDEGDLVLFVEDGGDRKVYRTRVDTPTPFVEIGSNITISSFAPNAKFGADSQAVYAGMDDRLWRIPLDASPAIPMSQPGASAFPEFDERDGYFHFRAVVTGNRHDLFRVPVTGGVAQFLNLDATHSSTVRPFFSPDGTFACFFERRTDFDLACSDLRGSSPQTAGFGTVAANNFQAGGGPTGQHLIASDNQTLFGICDECPVFQGLYRASIDGSAPVTVLTGSSLRIRDVRDLPAINRVLFRMFDTNSSTVSWQSTTYDFTQPVDYSFDGDFVGYDAGSDRLAFLTDVNPFPGVEIQLVSVRSDGSDVTALTGGGFSNGIDHAAATPDGTAVIAHERYRALPSLTEGVRLVRVRIDGTQSRVLGSFPRTGTSTPVILITVPSPTDSYGTASVLLDESLRTEIITYSGTPAPLFRDGFESAP